MTEDHGKWTNENSPIKGPTLSTSTSSFEALDPHDPSLSRLATEMFEKTSDYLHGELTATQDRYSLLEEINRVTITKYSDLKQIAVNLNKSLLEHRDTYTNTIIPLLEEIDALEENINQIENVAYKLDSYTKQLKQKFKHMEKK